MENWGLTTYRETYLLVDEQNTPAQSRQLTAAMIGHELAHQWFGNLVTMVNKLFFMNKKDFCGFFVNHNLTIEGMVDSFVVKRRIRYFCGIVISKPHLSRI